MQVESTAAPAAEGARAAELSARGSPSSPLKKHVAFSASAGCFPYQLGVASVLADCFDLSNVTFSGSSGGAWAAILLASERDITWSFEILTLRTPDSITSSIFGAYGQCQKSAQVVFDEIFRGVDLRRRVRGRLSIALTRIAWSPLPHFKNETVSKFFNNQDVFDCMIASSLIPYAVNGEPFVTYRGWVCVDSALTNVTGTLQALQYEWGVGVEGDDEGVEETKGESISDLTFNESFALSDALACSSGCRLFLEDLIALVRAILPFGRRPSASASASVSSSSSKLPGPSRSISLSTLAACDDLSPDTIEESKPFGLLSLGLRTSRSVASQLATVYLSPTSPTSPSSATPTAPTDGVETCDNNADYSTSQEEDQGSWTDSAKKSDNTYWHNSIKGTGIKTLAGRDDSLVLEITPWMWRAMPLHNYHLTKNSEHLWALFEMGRQDALVHMRELSLFFNS